MEMNHVEALTMWKNATGPRNAIVVPGDNMAEMFWNGVAQRGELTLFRQKKFGLWQSLSWNEVGAIVREAGMGLIELGFEVGETARSSATRVRNGCSPTSRCSPAAASARASTPPMRRARSNT
jgi:hypothetical protein